MKTTHRMSNNLQQLLARARQGHAYKREKIVLALTEEMLSLMEQQGINKTQLAAKLGKSKPYITKILSGTANFTLDSLIQLADALGTELNIHFTPLHCETQWIDFHSQHSQPLRKNSTQNWDQWQADELLETPQLLAQA